MLLVQRQAPHRSVCRLAELRASLRHRADGIANCEEQWHYRQDASMGARLQSHQ